MTPRFGVTYEGLKLVLVLIPEQSLPVGFGVTYEGLKLFQPENGSCRTSVLELPMRV